MKIGITHHKLDLDAGSCMRFLQNTGQVDEIVFGVEKTEDVAGRATEMIFADVAPPRELPGIRIEVYDQHQLEKEGKRVTSLKLLIKSKGIASFDPKKVRAWLRTVWLADFRKDSGHMDIKRALRRINDFMELTDEQVYERWFIPLMDSFLEKEKDVERGQRILRESILHFILKNPDSPGKAILRNWLEKIEKPETLDMRRNVFHFLCYMDEEIGRQWISLTIEALHREQVDFQIAREARDRESVRSAKVESSGATVIISQVTRSRSFNRVVRYMINSQDEALPPQIKEKTADPTRPWILIQVNPENMNFQIFSGGGRSGISREEYGQQMGKLIKALGETYTELVKALRAEILKARGKNIPEWQKLSEPGSLAGTEPLFFNKKDFPQILWGSGTHDAPPAKIFGENPEQIRKKLVEIAKRAIDKDLPPAYCDPRDCFSCPMHSWQLQKCHRKRIDVRKTKR